MLNKRKPKDILTHKQFLINQKAKKHTGKTDEWIQKNGLAIDSFNSIPIRPLQAQHQAHKILTHHSNLLTQSQRNTLEKFQQAMTNKRTRNRLKPTAANAVLNISSKINRQIFRQHRQLTKT
jgi:hypothetical protein